MLQWHLASWGLLVGFEKKTRACLSSLPFPPCPACSCLHMLRLTLQPHDLGRLPVPLGPSCCCRARRQLLSPRGQKEGHTLPSLVGSFQPRPVTGRSRNKPSAHFARPVTVTSHWIFGIYMLPLPKITVLTFASLAAAFRPGTCFFFPL